MSKQTIYSFYSKVNDSLLYMGTAQELVKQGWFKSADSVRSQASRAASGKLKRIMCYIDSTDSEEATP